MMAASIDVVTPLRSFTCTIQLNLPSLVKKQHGVELTTILNNDSNENSLVPAPSIRSLSLNNTLLDLLERIPTLNSLPLPHVGHQYSLSVVESLKKLRASKGSKKAFRNLDYNALGMQWVEFLPPIFHGDVLFELPPIEKLDLHSYTKLMHGMNKKNDGHSWTMTMTPHINNDMNLTFCTSSCISHLQCENQDCKYIS